MDKDEWVEENYGPNYPTLEEDERPFWRPGK
jgi:hypothetical protein